MLFNIDDTITVDCETEEHGKTRVIHVWDRNGNCMQERLGVRRWRNVVKAAEYLLKESIVRSVKTECGVTVSRGPHSSAVI